jgi:hypothetical protein
MVRKPSTSSKRDKISGSNFSYTGHKSGIYSAWYSLENASKRCHCFAYACFWQPGSMEPSIHCHTRKNCRFQRVAYR